jgi:hypothetical protein
MSGLKISSILIILFLLELIILMSNKFLSVFILSFI